MQTGFGQAQNYPSSAAPNQMITQNGNRPTLKEIPYDYVATFTLEGRRGNRVQDVINISVDGTFVAVAIGYSFISRQGTPEFDVILNNALTSNAASGIANSRAVNANFIKLLQPFLTPLKVTTNQPLPFITAEAFARCLALRLCGLDFKYSIVDSATGRELQNRPIHNIAGLGEPSGDRPFRPLAKPMVFQPRSTIRFEIEELSEGLLFAGAELFIVLHGYKILGVGTGS